MLCDNYLNFCIYILINKFSADKQLYRIQKIYFFSTAFVNMNLGHQNPRVSIQFWNGELALALLCDSDQRLTSKAL